MSGTSLDGIDLALIQTDGAAIAALGPGRTTPYTARARKALSTATELARNLPSDVLAERAVWPEPLARAEMLVNELNAAAIEAAVQAFQVRPRLVGFHGQTVVHRPDDGLTVQLGDGQWLARATGLPVVGNFRTADLAAGGQGAPLAPFFHHALSTMLGFHESWVALNIGGVANVTLVNPAIADPALSGAVLAFDTGPGCGMVDSWIEMHTGEGFDRDGKLAAHGRVIDSVLQSYLAHPYFALSAPKSLDRATFPLPSLGDLELTNGAATLLAFTCAAIAKGVGQFPLVPEQWLVAGGGRHNVELMRRLAQEVSGAVQPVEEFGINGDWVEAYAFAYLAERSVRGLPLTGPGTTGCSSVTQGGTLCIPDCNST